MTHDIILRVSNLSKAYKLYKNKSDRLKEALSFKNKQYSQLFYALNNISFDVKRGETIGIIGTNGSGKSTLLKILTGVVSPSEGQVEINGKVSALLELGAGFNVEYTGMENIYLNGTMMGFSREEMESRKDEIIAFADIGDYIHQPVKNYSSGMFARLAFAVAISVEPEILIVDEVLSVGDMRFQIKCMNRMKQMMENGTTILYVSHDISSVRRFCQRSIWINKGEMCAIGETNMVADMYSDFLKCNDVFVSEKVSEDEEKIEPFCAQPENGQIASIVGFEVMNSYGTITDTVTYNTPVTVRVTYDVYDTKVEDPVLGVALFSIDDEYICGLNTLLDNSRIPWKYGRNQFTLFYPDGLRVLGGKYYFDTALRDKTATVNIDYRKCVKEITVSSGYVAEGVFVIPHIWKNSPGNK